MDANRYSSGDATNQLCNKPIEGIEIRRDMNIGNGVREKLHPNLICNLPLKRESKRGGLILFKK